MKCIYTRIKIFILFCMLIATIMEHTPDSEHEHHDIEHEENKYTKYKPIIMR